jgi:hypothetical protein
VSVVRIPVGPELQARVLAPYKPHCRYLTRSIVELPEPGADHLVRLRGELGISSSCYIDETGHFNSVEFNLCYNQMIYTLMAQCVASSLLSAFHAMTLEDYFARQLPDVLIHEFSSKFRRPLNARVFTGTVSIVEAQDRHRFIVLGTHCTFEDGLGGTAQGDVSLAIVNREALLPGGAGGRPAALTEPG